MTTIITRLYADAAKADHVAGRLRAAGHGAGTIDVIGAGGDLHGRLAAAGVGAAAAAAYAGGIASGGSLVVVRAPFNPIGAARNAMMIVDDTPSVAVGLESENVYVRHRPEGSRFLSILSDHPRIFASDAMEGRKRGLASEAFGIRTLSARKTKTSAMGKARRIMTGNLRSRTFLTSAGNSRFSLSRMLGLPTLARSR
jgi:hypothetical protein